MHQNEFKQNAENISWRRKCCQSENKETGTKSGGAVFKSSASRPGKKSFQLWTNRRVGRVAREWQTGAEAAGEEAGEVQREEFVLEVGQLRKSIITHSEDQPPDPQRCRTTSARDSNGRHSIYLHFIFSSAVLWRNCKLINCETRRNISSMNGGVLSKFCVATLANH